MAEEPIQSAAAHEGSLYTSADDDPSSSPLAAEKEKGLDSAQEETPTSTDKQGLMAVRSHIPYRVWLVQGLILLERAAFYGVSQPFQNYLQLPTDNPTRPGALGLGQARAVLIIYVWFIYSYCTPLAGGLLADCWVGRRKAIQIGFMFYVLGLALLTGTAFSQRIYGKGGLPGFILSLVLMGAGTGAAKPNMIVFLVDQCPEEEAKVVVLKNGKSAVTSRELTIRYIYNANYWATNLGALCGIITTTTELHAGFGYAFLISLCSIFLATILFQIGYSRFITAPPAGNVLVTVFKTLRRRHLLKRFRKSDRTGEAISSSSSSLPIQQDGSANSTEVEVSMVEVKAALRACLVFLPFPALMLTINIMDNSLIAQAGEMQTHGLPNDIMYNLNPISVMVLLPMLQGWLYPFLARRKINFTPQQRIAVGLFCAALGMGYSSGIQQLIYSSGPCYSHPLKCLSGNIPNEVNVGAQTPTYVFLALAEILAIVSGTELAYTQAPASMKSIVQAIFMFFSALGAVLGVGVSFAAYDPNMVIVYGSIAGLLVFATFAFEIGILRKFFG